MKVAKAIRSIFWRSHKHADNDISNSTETHKASTKHSLSLSTQHSKEPESEQTQDSLSKYEMMNKIGDGAFSTVYRATEKATGRRVAIKVVRKFEINSQQRNNVIKEVQIMRQLKHPNILTLLEFIESDDFYYLVLDLCEGGELFHQVVKLTYFSEDLSRHLMKQIGSAVKYLHDTKGVVHRDIKLENLLFDPIPIIPSHTQKKSNLDEHKADEGEFVPGVGGGGIGRVKIADFGLSKIIWSNETMTPCGTIGYTAPEIVKDQKYSKSVDMWALGCVLYTLLCGFPPFYDESILALTEKVAKGEYSFISPWWDDVSDSAKDLIGHLLTVDTKKRYNIDQFMDHPWMSKAKKSNHQTSPTKHHVSSTHEAENLRRTINIAYDLQRKSQDSLLSISNEDDIVLNPQLISTTDTNLCSMTDASGECSLEEQSSLKDNMQSSDSIMFVNPNFDLKIKDATLLTRRGTGHNII